MKGQIMPHQSRDGDTSPVALTIPLDELPECITINGIRYVRNDDIADMIVNRINIYKSVMDRTQLPWREVIELARNEIWR